MLFKKEAIVYCNDVPPNEIQEELKLQRERKNQKERERYAKMDPAAKAEFNKRRSARRKEQRMIKRQAMMPPYASTVDVVSKEMEITLRLLVHLFAQLNLQVPAFVNAVNPSAPKRQRLASLMPSEVLFTASSDATSSGVVSVVSEASGDSDSQPPLLLQGGDEEDENSQEEDGHEDERDPDDSLLVPQVHPRSIMITLRQVYRIIHRTTGSLGGNGHGGPIYGELIMSAMQKIIDMLVEFAGLGIESLFLDSGCGLGRNILCALYFLTRFNI